MESNKQLMEKKHICYYSNKCQWSKAFIMEVSNTPYKKQFQYVCVDPPLTQALPKFLKKVPTLVIQGESEPRVDGEGYAIHHHKKKFLLLNPMVGIWQKMSVFPKRLDTVLMIQIQHLQETVVLQSLVPSHS